MRKKIFLLIFLLAIIGVVLVIKNTKKEPTPRACFEGYCFDVELAVSPSEQKRGLMFREQLDSDKGMLFIFKEEGGYSFWMKNTLIPLDIIWINGNREVVFISENTSPCKEDFCPLILPLENAKYVLELNGGTTKKIDLALGDKMDFDI